MSQLTFKQLISLVDALMKRSKNDHIYDALFEVDKRLRELELLEIEIQEFVAQYRSIDARGGKNYLMILRKIDLHAECFYHISWSLILALRVLLNKKRFTVNCISVVRNKLLVHPEDFSWAMAFFDGDPAIRVGTLKWHKISKDERGVFAHSNELKMKVFHKLKQVRISK